MIWSEGIESAQKCFQSTDLSGDKKSGQWKMEGDMMIFFGEEPVLLM